MSDLIRIGLSISAEDLETIDAAAEAAGVTRSEYLRASALDRAAREEGRLTAAQRRAVTAAVRAAVEEL